MEVTFLMCCCSFYSAAHTSGLHLINSKMPTSVLLSKGYVLCVGYDDPAHFWCLTSPAPHLSREASIVILFGLSCSVTTKIYMHITTLFHFNPWQYKSILHNIWDFWTSNVSSYEQKPRSPPQNKKLLPQAEEYKTKHAILLSFSSVIRASMRQFSWCVTLVIFGAAVPHVIRLGKK